MSIIFQLFHAEDLRELNQEQLNKLVETIKTAVDASGDSGLQASIAVSMAIEAELDKEPPPSMPLEFIDTLRKRAHEVFRQLTSQPPSDQPAPRTVQQDKAQQSIFKQLLNPADFDRLNNKLGSEGRTILMWAIVCEADNLRSYNSLWNVQDHAKTIVSGPTGTQRLKDPDSLYSPFNPLSPPYKLGRGRPSLGHGQSSPSGSP